MSSISQKRKLLVSDVMTTSPTTLPPTATVREAATLMRDENIGDVLVVDGDSLTGIVTDRDIVVRGVALGRDPEQLTLREIASASPRWICPDQHAFEAVSVMREHAVHRLPVLDHGRVVGIVSIGDLALRLEDRGMLASVFAGQHADD